MTGIFISYRRADSQGSVGRLYDHLIEILSKDQLFLDVDSIKPGQNFIQSITKSISSCEVVLVVIGPQWLSISDDSGKRRLDDPKDYVREEIRIAHEIGVPIIPVLVEQAIMPRVEQLPKDIAFLATYNAIEISHARFNYDRDRLVSAIRDYLSPGLVRITRVDRSFGRPMQAHVFLDGREIGQIKTGESIEAEARTGDHHIFVRSAGFFKNFIGNHSETYSFQLRPKETVRFTLNVKIVSGWNKFVLEQQ